MHLSETTTPENLHNYFLLSIFTQLNSWMNLKSHDLFQMIQYGYIAQQITSNNFLASPRAPPFMYTILVLMR